MLFCHALTKSFLSNISKINTIAPKLKPIICVIDKPSRRFKLAKPNPILWLILVLVLVLVKLFFSSSFANTIANKPASKLMPAIPPKNAAANLNDFANNNIKPITTTQIGSKRCKSEVAFIENSWRKIRFVGKVLSAQICGNNKASSKLTLKPKPVKIGIKLAFGKLSKNNCPAK